MILCYELSDQEAHTLHQVKAHDVRAFATSKVFQSGVPFPSELYVLVSSALPTTRRDMTCTVLKAT